MPTQQIQPICQVQLYMLGRLNITCPSVPSVIKFVIISPEKIIVSANQLVVASKC